MGLIVGLLSGYLLNIFGILVVIVVWVILAYALKKSKDESHSFLIFGLIGWIIMLIIVFLFIGAWLLTR